MSSETRGVKVATTKDGMTITSDNPTSARSGAVVLAHETSRRRCRDDPRSRARRRRDRHAPSHRGSLGRRCPHASRTRRYVEANIAGDCSLATLAREAGRFPAPVHRADRSDAAPPRHYRAPFDACAGDN
jgi:hypothetical protein